MQGSMGDADKKWLKKVKVNSRNLKKEQKQFKVLWILPIRDSNKA
jgi:hypothetical protein